MAYDFESIKQHNRLSEVVGRHLKLRRVGHEMVALCPFHKEKSASFTISDDKGFFHCFGCGAHGDVVDYVERYHSITVQQAIEYLGGEKTYDPAPRQRPVDKSPPIVAAPTPSDHAPFVAGQKIRAWAPKQGGWATYLPDYVWPYHDASGYLVGYVLRIDTESEKVYRPLRPVRLGDETVWATVGFESPRPLYGLNRLAPDGPILITEGEKASDAGRDLFPDHSSLTWSGGASAVSKTDFTPLAGRDVLIWGDADVPGEQAANDVAQKLLRVGARPLVMSRDLDKPRGWDAADAQAEGWTPDDAAAYVASRTLSTPEPIAGIFDANPFDGELPPPRPWAFGNILLHRTVTAITAPAGTGKSTWSLQLAIAFSQHIALGPFDPVRTGPVWLWNNEDDKDELNRRTFAACAAMDVPVGNLAGRLYLNSGSERQLIVAKENPKTSEIIAQPDVDRVIEVIKELGIKLLVIDPFAETFELETENSNDAMKRVARLYRDIAQQADCSVLIITHTPKGTNSDRSAGDLDAIRGGSAIGGVVRSAWTMFSMSEQDAEDCDIPPESRHLYVRLDAAKSNMSLRGNEAIWWRKEGIHLGNAEGGYPEDIVGTLRSVEFRPPLVKKAEIRADMFNAMCDEIVRVCLKNNWIDARRAATLDTVAGALNRAVTGMGTRAAKDKIISQIEAVHGHGEYVICLSERPHGLLVRRTIHVELNEG